MKKKNNVLLLFKNALKQAFRNKIQLIGLAVLVLLSSTIFSLMQTSIARVNNEYQNLISEQQSNIHDFIFDPYNTTKKITNDQIINEINKSNYSSEFIVGIKVDEINKKITSEFIKAKLKTEIANAFINSLFIFNKITLNGKDLKNEDLEKTGSLDTEIIYNYDSNPGKTKLSIKLTDKNNTNITDNSNNSATNSSLVKNDEKIINSQNPDGVLEEQQLYLNEASKIKGNQFIWDRVEARTVQLENNNDPKILKLITYNQYARIDKLIISQGFNIGKNPNEKTLVSKQTVINKEFAQKNNLHIGDTIRVQADRLGETLKVSNEYDINDPKYSNLNWLKIVGFGTSADFITPIIDQTTPLPNKTKEGILYIDPSQFGLTEKTNVDNNTLWYYNKSQEQISITSNNDIEIYFVGKSIMKEKNNINAIAKFFQDRYINFNDANAKLVYALGDNNYRFNNRTATLPSTIKSFTTLLIALLLIVLVITGITVILITFKNIDNSKPQIGILKSLGYSNGKILITSLAYPMLAAFIGTILVFLPASGLQILVVNTFANYFNLNFGKFVFNGLGYLYCLLLTFGFLSLVAWIISALTVIKNPITLINNISSTRDSSFTKFVKKTSKNRKFLTRFRLALFTSSIGKMAAVSLTMFLGTTLMTTAIIGPKIMSDNEKVTYTGMNYKSLTEYVNPTFNSPFSFYKTYNPNNKPYEENKIEPWKYIKDKTSQYQYPERTDRLYAQELWNNDINSEAYAPIAPNPQDPAALSNLSLQGLTYLYGKMMTKSFLDGLNNSNTDPMLISIIVQLAWPEAQGSYTIANETDDAKSLYTLTNYQTLRTFYMNYRSTIAMDLNPEVVDSTDPNQLNKVKLKEFAQDTTAWSADKQNFENELLNFEFDKKDTKYPWHISNEDEFLATSNPSKEEFRDQWIRKTMIWFYSIFYNRAGQAVIQGTYTKSPYFIKQNIAKALQDPKAQFNISFNVIPFDKTTDELGTYFLGTPEIKFNNNQYPIKVYGLQNQNQLHRPSYMQLYDDNNNSLNPSLERTNSDGSINIVINQTIAKQLKMKTNETFYMSTNGNVMMTNQDKDFPNTYEPINLSDINFDKINTGEPKTENNANILNQNTSFEKIPTTKNGAYTNAGVNATPMLKEVQKGHVVINHDNILHKFKVAGIYNGYGQPAAYISKNNADELLHFNKSKAALYEIFKREWQNKGTVKNINFDKLKSDPNYSTYEKFKEVDENDPLKIIFNNEFPIFNFKLSNSDTLNDISTSFSVSQPYGDYSAFALNGGTIDNINYKGYGEGSAVNILPLYIHKQLLDQITQLVNTILLFFIIFSLVISFFIILLTSNLVIYENQKIIATMKTLGYSNAKITNIVIGMYLPVILAMWIIASPIGWIIVRSIINYLAYNTTWVLPLFFVWWLPLVVGLIVLTIYAATFAIEWLAMRKINPLKILNETN